MKIFVTKDIVKIEEYDLIHKGEYKINKCFFNFSEDFIDSLTKKAIFSTKDISIEVPIINNKCDIPKKILELQSIVLIGVYAYKIVDDKLEIRYSPSPSAFNVIDGSYIKAINNPEEVSFSQFDKYMQALNDGLNKIESGLIKMDTSREEMNNLIDNINQKLENGDFNGDIGPQGRPGRDGINGTDGKDAIINGQNTVNITTDNNITLKQEKSALKLSLNNQLIPKNNIEGSDNIFNDGLDMPLFALCGDGKSEQETTTGKNLLRCVKTKPETINGVTFTPIYNNGLLLYINVNGTSTANTNFYISTDSFANNETLQPGTYTLSDNVPGQDGTKYFTYIDVELSADYNLSTVAEKTVTIPQETKLKSRIVVRSGVTLNNVKFYPLLEKSSSATKYEPYTGGQPSPNPNYPQDIEVLKGYNLYNGTLEQGAIDGTGGENVSTTRVRSSIIYLKKGTYTVNASGINNGNYHIYSTNETWEHLGSKTWLALPFSFNLNDDKYIRLTFRNSTDEEITVNNISNVLIVKGTESKPYLPYGCIGYKVNRKNFLPNYREDAEIINGITFTKNEDGSVTINGTSTNVSQYRLCKAGELLLKPNTYILSSKNIIPTSMWLTFNNNRKDVIAISKNNNGTFTLTENSKNALVYVYINSGVTINNLTIYPMISLEGGEYEPYQEQVVAFNLNKEKLRSVGDVKDELVVDLDTGDYYKLNKIRHLELAIADMNNGENYPGWNNIPFISEDFPNFQTSLNKNNSSILCNILTQPTDLSSSGVGINTVNGEILYLSKTKFNLTQTQWKEQYPDLIFKLDYVIPTTEKTKLGTLSPEDLAKLRTFEGYNNIKINTNLGLMNIRLTYGLDIKRYVDNKIAQLSEQLIKGE